MNTEEFQTVSAIMPSPNYWEDNAIGNKHYFFMLEDCQNDNPIRGFYNEFLKKDLHEHRKVMELVGSTVPVEKAPEALNGLGFSNTKRDYLICKVTGSYTRVLKIQF